MGRLIGGIVVGYIVMILVTFVLMTLAWNMTGADFAFRLGEWSVSKRWLVVMCTVGFVSAVAGGVVGAAIAKQARVATVFPAFVLIFGILVSLPVLMGNVDVAAFGPRGHEVPMLEAMTKIQQPRWTAIVFPIISAAGVLLGTRMRPAPAA